MGFTGASSIVIALAIGLWLCYAVPTWLRHRNELAVERNAWRLQHTIRLLAESAESDDIAEVSSSRQAGGDTDAVQTEPIPVVPRMSEPEVRAARQFRRGRLLSTSVLVLGLLGAGLGAWSASVNGNWWMLAISLLFIAGAFMMLQRLQHVAERRRAAREASRTATAASSARRAHVLPDEVLTFEPASEKSPIAEPEAALVGWTPTPLPKPLYLGRDLSDDPDGGPGNDGPRVERDHMAELMAAVRRSEEAIREAHRGAGVATFGAMEAITVDDDAPLVREPRGGSSAMPFQTVPREGSASSRWASMGIVGEVEPEFEDLSQVLRRRRAS